MTTVTRQLWGDYRDSRSTSNPIVSFLATARDKISPSNMHEDFTGTRTSDVVLKSVDTLSSKAQQILGAHGTKRFTEFKKYRKGWDSGTGQPLVFRSVAVMEYFISRYNKFKVEPSIFMTRDGNVQLGWERGDGSTVELEFSPDRIHYYLTAEDEEGDISLSDDEGLRHLIYKLQ